VTTRLNEKVCLLESAAYQAAQENETDIPVLARSLFKYRSHHSLSVEQMAGWLQLANEDEFYHLALCLRPINLRTPLQWRDYTLKLAQRFPSLNLKRLQLVIEFEPLNLPLKRTVVRV